MQTPRIPRWVVMLATLLLVIGIGRFVGLPSMVLRADTEPQRGLTQAWELAQKAGSYHFSATTKQTLIPRPVAEMIGERDQNLTLETDGAVMLPDRILIEMRVAGNGQHNVATLMRDGNQTFLLREGILKPVDDALSLASPTHDVLGYLAAAEYVTLLTPPEGHPHLIRYGFELNGPLFEQYVRQQAEKSLASQPGAPEGLRFQPMIALQTLTGRGELWVNTEGLPVRQVLYIDMPEMSDLYSARLEMVADLSGYGEVPSLPAVIQGSDGAWGLQGGLRPISPHTITHSDDPLAMSAYASSYDAAMDGLPTATASWHARLVSRFPIRVAPSNLALFVFMTVGILLVRLYQRNPRRCYTLIICTIVPIMVLSPLLQAGGVIAFLDRQARASEQRAQAVPDLLHSLGVELSPEPAEPVINSPAAYEPASGPVASLDVPMVPRSDVIYEAQTVQNATGMAICGDGEPGVDTDGDGLTDQEELCLGTNPYAADTDGDGLPDLVEVEGFWYNGRLWTSDPLKPDSSGDGILDFMGYPREIHPMGQVSWDSVDLDGDGIPNLWDDDADGDGVPNWLDISPFAVTDYANEFELSIEGSEDDGYIFVEIQVQPEDLDHLRYSTTALDWPYDDKGNVQNLTGFGGNLRLIPHLLIRSNVQPREDLAQKYGFSSWADGDSYVLLVPLLPVEEYGAIYAFYAKVAYAPGQTADVQWQTKMVWMVQMETNRRVDWSVVTETRTLHQYEDVFRVTGFKITKDQGYEAAILGTPGETDDLYLFKILMGLNDTFQMHARLEGQASDQTALQELAERFAVGSTASLVHTFDVPREAVAMQGPNLYGHAEAALFAVGSDLVPTFLETYDIFYGNARCQDADKTPVNCASLIIAYEQSLGVEDLRYLMQSHSDGVLNLHVNLADVAVLTVRGLQMSMYEEGAAGWQKVTPARALELIEQRYASSYSTALRDLYPGLTIDDLRYMTYTTYLFATTPSYRPIKVDGQLLVGELADEAQLAMERSLGPDLAQSITTAVDYFALGSGLANAVGTAANMAWFIDDIVSMPKDWGKYTFSMNTFKVAGEALFAASTIASTAMGIINAICASTTDLAMCRNEDVLKIINIGVDALAIVYQIQYVTQLVIEYAMKTLETISTVAMMAQAVGVAISIGLTWAAFAMALAFGGTANPVVWRMALAEAIVTTIWLIVLFALNFIPVIGQVIAAILALIDMLLSLFTGLFADKTYNLSLIVLGMFYDAAVCTNVYSADFGSFSSELRDPNMGLVAGNAFLLKLPASGIIELLPDGKVDDLYESYIEGQLTWMGQAYDPETWFTAQDMSEPVSCQVEYYGAFCDNVATMGYALTPQINGVVSFDARHNYQIVWAEFGMYHAWRWKTHTMEGVIPDYADTLTPQTMYLDVLPATLKELWHWDAINNSDWDGDGLTNEQELILGTNPYNWDTDGDGLSDYYEWLTFGTHGADPLKYDTDGDGLSDRQELELGTRVDVADTDGDGLLDGEEIRRLVGGELVGGWEVTLPGGRTVWVSSDPLRADADADGLNDAEERANGLSPHAANPPVPILGLRASPIRGIPGARAGTYWQADEEIEIRVQIANGTPEAVVTTLRLELPDWIVSVEGGVMEGDRTVAPTAFYGGGYHGLQWSLSGATALQKHEAISTVITARTSALSGSGEIVLSMMFGDVHLRKAISAVLDNDDPHVMILAPTDGAILSGTSYVVGGAAWDATTWLTDIELSIVSQESPADFVPLPSTASPWAHGWSLPADGVYTLQARATDVMGHVSTTDLVSVSVDNTPPMVTLDSEMIDGTSRTLQGTAIDNLSGVERVQLAVGDQPWQSVALEGSTWSYLWALGQDAQGSHAVSIRAIDRAGNQSDVVTYEIIVDAVAPSSIVTAGADRDLPPAIRPNVAFQLTGVADEGGHLPLPATSADLRTGMDVFDDSTVWLGLSSIRDNDGGVVTAWVGDLNADRMADLAIGLPGPAGDAGQVQVLYGRAGGWAAPPELEMLAAVSTRLAGAPGAGLGSLLAAAGDTNGDGHADLLIGERASSRAFLVFGSPGRLLGVTLDQGKMGYHTLLQAPATIESLASAGDVNGDGYDDILIVAGGTAYLLLGRGVWPEKVDVAAEAVASVAGVTGALGVGDVNGDQYADWVTMANSRVDLYLGSAAPSSASPAATFASSDTAPGAIALGDVNGDERADWLYASGDSRILVYGQGASTHTFTGYDGLFAAPGDVDGDGRADILLANADGVASLIGQPASGAPALFATIAGVGGAANAPYALGADVNADGSADLLLIPSRAAAEERGFDAPDFESGIVALHSLPRGAMSATGMGGGEEGAVMMGREMGILSIGPDTRYVDDDKWCDGNTPCFETIQQAVNASDGGADTVIVYPGVYKAFRIPAGANYDYLTVRGVSADAVFVEANPGAGQTYAIRVEAKGVRLSDMTVRNATIGIELADGAGEPTQGGGHETSIEKIVAHSVETPISMSEAAALTLTDSTLVGDGTRPIIQVEAGTGASHAWAQDRAVALPVTDHGGLLAAGNTLYAVPGGTSRAVYASTPGSEGALGNWSNPFTLKYHLPYDTGYEIPYEQEGRGSLLTASNTALYQLQSHVLWPSLGGLAEGANATTAINAVAIHPVNGDIYVGGSFTRIGTTDTANIARWDGTSWHKVGGSELLDNGVNGPVHALHFAPAVGNDSLVIPGQYHLYIGGEFTGLNNGLAVGRVVRWTGSQWETLGASSQNGVNGPVYAITNQSDGRVFLGGNFTQAFDGAPDLVRSHIIGYIKRAPGSSLNTWFDAGGNMNGPVHSLVATGGVYDYIYAGGAFTANGSTPMNRVARWYYPASGWTALGDGFTSTVNDLVIDRTTCVNNLSTGWKSVCEVYGVSDSDAVKRWSPLAATPSWIWVPGVSPNQHNKGPKALLADGEGNIYVGGYGPIGPELYVQRKGATSFVQLGRDAYAGSESLIKALALDSTGHVYAGTNWIYSYAGHAPRSWTGISRWSIASVFERTVPTGNWTRLAYPPLTNQWQVPEALEADPVGNLYAVWGSYAGGVLYRLDRATNTWTERALPDAALYLKGLVWADGKLYALGHNGAGAWRLSRYDPSTNGWTRMTDPPLLSGIDAGVGLSLTWDGGDAIYMLRGDGTSGFARYRISGNSWQVMSAPTIDLNISRGPALARIGRYLYVYGTPGDGVTSNLFRYGALSESDVRLTVRRTAFVAPDTATSFAWTNLSAAGGVSPFLTDIDASNAWVAPATATWSPALPAGSTRLTSEQADFVAPAEGLYRLGPNSTLNAGYHRYMATAQVFPSQAACSGCDDGSLVWGETAFGTIREAIESGAARVLVRPGRYPQTFYLVSGVDVIGSGAELTLIEPPAGLPGTLVAAEGIARASLARVTLAGGSGWTGFLAEGGARGITLTRNIIRDLDVGVYMRENSAVEIVNNTIVRNRDGIVAEGTNPVNVRNTILAYHMGTGLLRGAAPTSLSNTYNAFWANGTDMDPVDVGGGKLFVDPRFRSLVGNDFRLQASSPLIDKGAPNDPTVPGGGARIDIGYAEYNAASFYVSKDYSETGLNDGLMWGVDAFDSIQPALDAAARTLYALQGALPEGGYTVGVDRGVYVERVSIPSRVRLVGLGAEQATIDAGGTGSAVTFDAVINARLSGLTLRNAGSTGAGVNISNAASGITLDRVVIHGSAGAGLRLDGGSSARVAFSTIADNAGAGILTSGTATWAQVENSILHNNLRGLEAAAGSLIRNDYNLLNNTTNVVGVTAGANTVTGDPLFATVGHYQLTADSPALDAADPHAEVPLGGGVRADLGYMELRASPLMLLFGPEIKSIVTANTGVEKVEVGVRFVSDATLPPSETLPSAWETLTPAEAGQPLFYWAQSISRANPGLYRVYSRATDVAGNVEEHPLDWYEGSFVIDNTPPTVVWGSPALPGSTSAAAVLAVAQVAGTLDTGTGTRDDVAQSYFAVSGPAGTVTYPMQDGQAWIPLPAVGNYQIRAVAIDEAGNQAEASASVAVSATEPVATVIGPVSGDAVSASDLTLRGYVRFGASGAGQVEVSVDGGASVQATLATPGAAFSTWSAEINLPAGDGAKTIIITPSLGDTTGEATSVALTLDTTAPQLAVATPLSGTASVELLSFTGTASDTGGGLAWVEVSIDGGYTWQQAELSNGAWGLDVVLDERQDHTSYPAQVRAVDRAGNIAFIEWPVAVDNMPPTGLGPVTLSQPKGQHLELGAGLSITWNTPVDAGGPTEVLLAVDRNEDTVPSEVVTGTNADVVLDAVGDWYVHLAARDAAGNEAIARYGPWHVRDMTNASFGARRQSIIVDGFIDLGRGEWKATDLLGTDVRGLETQQLYVTWDAEAIYLGWSGAWWTLDGSMWAYLDLTAGGSNQPVSGAFALPIVADLAVLIEGPETGSLYVWNGSAWVLSESPLGFAHGPSGDAEARIPWSLDAGQAVGLVALALPPEVPVAPLAMAMQGMAPSSTVAQVSSAGGQPWAIFPNVNVLDESPTTAFQWDTPVVDDMSAGQPVARTVLLDLNSRQASSVARCPGSTLEYGITVTNPEPTPMTGLEVRLLASEGLSYLSQDGATCGSCPTGGSEWTLTLPDLAAGVSTQVVVTGVLASDLSGLSAVSSTFSLPGGEVLPSGSNSLVISHRVDGAPPTVTIGALAGSAIAAGTHTFVGTASDGVGSGVGRVEVSLDGGSTWHTASGAMPWSATLEIPSAAGAQVTLQARAIDQCGLIGPATMQAYHVDSTPPQVTWTVPAVITSTMALLSGSTYDPAPAGALVQSVEVQIDSDQSAWLKARGPQLPVDGEQSWNWTWHTAQEDGVEHRLRARATDSVGNSTITVWQSTVVDVVGPQITVIERQDSVLLPSDITAGALMGGPLVGALNGVTRRYLPIMLRGSAETVNLAHRMPLTLDPMTHEPISTEVVMRGTATDGSGVATVRLQVYDPLGNVSIDEASLVDGLWEYAPDLRGWDIGTYTLRVEAADIHGNIRVQGPYLLEVEDRPIEGLTAKNDGPRFVGQTVTMIAELSEGSNVAYTWDLGDGESARGAVVQHAYAEPGVYTATVTAANSVSTQQAETVVTILLLEVVAGEDQEVDEGDTVMVSATFVGRVGETHTATIDWGDESPEDAGDVDDDAFTITGSHVYADDGTYTVTVTVRDSQGNAASDTLVVTVHNVAPTATLRNSGPVDEGHAVRIWFEDLFDPGTADTHTFSFDWNNDGTFDIEDQQDAWAEYVWLDDGIYTVRGRVQDDDGGWNEYTTEVVVNNAAPVVSAGPESQTVQYSDPIAEITIVATDVEPDTMTAELTWSDDGSTFHPAPAGLALDAGSCGVDAGLRTCTWTVAGAISMPAGIYALEITVTDKDGGVGAAQVQFIVEPETAVVAFDSGNPVAVRVEKDGGASGPFTLGACVYERHDGSAGDINLAEMTMRLVPVGPGGTIIGSIETTTVQDGRKCMTWGLGGVPVNTYTVEVEVSGGYYAGSGEDALVVYDPSLGFATGGGWFYWPGTARDDYAGDRTNFAFNLRYNKQGKNVQGNLLMIRHLEDESIYRVKSNALHGLALGEDRGVPMGWASFTGKSTYQEPGWPEPIGNHEFTVYVEDHDEPGRGIDRFWIEVNGGLSMPREATVNAVTIGGGNIVVPHNSR